MKKRGKFRVKDINRYSKKAQLNPDVAITAEAPKVEFNWALFLVIGIIILVLLIVGGIYFGYINIGKNNISKNNSNQNLSVENNVNDFPQDNKSNTIISNQTNINSTITRSNGGGGGGGTSTTCTKRCIGKTCGDDSCGGSCGSCSPGYDCISSSCILIDFNVPQFSNYYDNSYSIKRFGIAIFNVKVVNTNGSVFLSINGKNYSATNLTSDVYNVSLNLSSRYYEYFWYSYGNSSNNVYNISSAKNYTVNGTTYYISSSIGNDGYDGLTINTPWKSVSKVYSKSISPNKFQPNDNILLKAGDIFDGFIEIANPGRKNSPITISRYGNGANPIIYGDHPTIVWTVVQGHSGLYSADIYGGMINAVFDSSGNKYNQTDRGTDTLDNWLNSLNASNWGFEFSPERVYIHTIDNNPPTNIHLFEWAAVYAHNNANYTIIENLDVRNGYIGIVTTGSTGVIVRNNQVSDTADIGIYFGSKASDGEIVNNIINRTGETSIYLSEGRNIWVHNNIIKNTTGIISGINVSSLHKKPERCGVGLQQGVGNLVEYNNISYVEQSVFDYWAENYSIVRYNYGFHSGGGAYPDGVGLKVYNNIFNLDGIGEGFGGSYDGGNTPSVNPNLIYNNIIYNFTGYGIYSANNSIGEIFRNNIFVIMISNRFFVEINPGIDLDYNCYYSIAGSTWGWNWNNHGYSNLSTYSSISGLDSHSIYADPLFVSSSPKNPEDFRLDPTSPCIDIGQNLKTAGLLSADYNYSDFTGTNIPQGAGVDIGGYER